MKKTFPTLYKLSNTGKIVQWTVWAEKGNPCSYTVEHGQKNGKLQTSTTEIRVGKNIGKKNETTVWEQTQSEAESLWNNKKNRSGYSEKIPSEKPLLPMLAHNYKDHGHKIVFPCYGQAKKDGLRCIIRIGGEIQLFSRKNVEFTSLEHLKKAMQIIPPTIALDGELFSYQLTFQEITSLCRRETFIEECKKINFVAYDIVDEKTPYKDRYKQLLDIGNTYNIPYLEILESHLIKERDEVDIWLQKMLDVEEEGLILRNLDGVYEINKRSKHLQKYKVFEDAEFPIVGVKEGIGKFAGMGIFICELPDHTTFDVTPSATEEEKREILSNKKSYIGQMLTVSFQGWTTSESPKPRFPVGKGIRFDI